MTTAESISASCHLLASNQAWQGLDASAQAVVDRMPEALALAWARARDRSGSDVQMSFLLDDLESQSGGGKFIRSRLAALSYLGFGGTSDTVVTALAASVQLLHTGLCAHDDLIDAGQLRHGRPTVRSATVQRLRGNCDVAQLPRQADAAALLAGDLALALALDELLALSDQLSAGTLAALLSCVVRDLQRAIAGELLDVRSETIPPADTDPVRIAELKTSAYSFQLPLRLGALAAEADSGQLRSLAEIGAHLGIAYQLVDDLLDVYGTADVVGKSEGSDLRSGKRTELLRHAVRVASADDHRRLTELLGSDVDAAGLATAREIFGRTGSQRHVAELAERHTRAAAALIVRDLPPDLAASLVALTGWLGRRDR